MKKFTFFLAAVAFAAFTLTMSAQHVAPITIQLADFNLDTFRTKYANDPAQYATELQRIVLLQEAEVQAIKEAWKELKDEKAHAKNLASCLKEVNSSIATLQKSTEKEMSELKDVLKLIEKQQKSLRSLPKLNADTRDTYADYLSGEKRYLDTMTDEITERQKNLSKALSSTQELQNGLNAFNVEIQQKELDLKQLESTSKARSTTIKNEQKIVKAMLKNK